MKKLISSFCLLLTLSTPLSAQYLGSIGTTSAAGVTVGTSIVAGGITGRVLYDNAGTLGEYAISGTVSVCMTTSCVMTTPNLGTPSALNLSNATALPAAALPAFGSGDVSFASGGGASTIAANAVSLAKLATQATNTVLGNATSGTAVPTALAVGSCSSASSALIWTTNTGPGCNTSITAAAVPASGITGTTIASGVTASSLVSGGANFTIGAGTTGTNVANSNINGGSGTAGGSTVTFNRNSSATSVLGDNSAIVGGTSSDLTMYATASNGVRVYTNGNNLRTTVDSSGHAFFYSLSTSGSGTQYVCITSGNELINDNAACIVSARRFKDEITPLAADDGLADVMRLAPVSYICKPEFCAYGMEGKRQLGFIADDVVKIDERLVIRDKDGEVKSLAYDRISAKFALAIQQQQREIEDLKKRLPQ